MSASREAFHGDGEPTHEDVLAAFRRQFDKLEFPEQATDAEIAAILAPRVPLDMGSCGPNQLSIGIKMTAKSWRFWAHWLDVLPSSTRKPVLSGKRAFVKAAREAFGIGFPAPNRGAAIETLAIPPALHHRGEGMKGEILPPAGVDLEGLLAPVEGDTFLDWPDFERECSRRARSCPQAWCRSWSHHR